MITFWLYSNFYCFINYIRIHNRYDYESEENWACQMSTLMLSNYKYFTMIRQFFCFRFVNRCCRINPPVIWLERLWPISMTNFYGASMYSNPHGEFVFQSATRNQKYTWTLNIHIFSRHSHPKLDIFWHIFFHIISFR